MMTFPKTHTLNLSTDQLDVLRAVLSVHLEKHQDLIKVGGYASDSHIGEVIRVYNMAENLRRGEDPNWNVERLPHFLRGE